MEKFSAAEAFKLAGQIGFHYHRKSIHSDAINEVLAKSLGPDLYKKFCEEIRNSESRIQNLAVRKHFKKEFLNSPVKEEDCMNDMEVYNCFSLNSLMETLAKVVA